MARPLSRPIQTWTQKKVRASLPGKLHLIPPLRPATDDSCSLLSTAGSRWHTAFLASSLHQPECSCHPHCSDVEIEDSADVTCPGMPMVSEGGRWGLRPTRDSTGSALHQALAFLLLTSCSEHFPQNLHCPLLQGHRCLSTLWVPTLFLPESRLKTPGGKGHLSLDHRPVTLYCN